MALTPENLIKLFTQEYKDINASRESAYNSYDKVLIAFSSAGLGYSISLLSNTTGLSNYHYIVLALTWICFAGSIASSVWSMKRAGKDYGKLLGLLNERFTKLSDQLQEQEKDDTSNKVGDFAWWYEDYSEDYEEIYGKDTTTIERLNSLTFAGAMLGMILLLMFALILPEQVTK